MYESEVITSEGEGIWGARYDLGLLTSVRIYSDSLHQANKNVQRYVLEFGPKSQADSNSRIRSHLVRAKSHLTELTARGRASPTQVPD
jgi:hypothetical protein